MEDWDLQAIVRGCSRQFADAKIEDTSVHYSCYIEKKKISYNMLQEDDFFQTNNTGVALDELDELYKPFYPKDDQGRMKEEQIILPRDIEKHQLVATNMNVVIAPKRRKNQSKKVVKQVRVEDLSLDTWAWRKYGQKPIKGSPYPRSYYRCSSLKGCLARKQVERSYSDPTIFIVSYTSEHSHSLPVRRNTLAGVPKKKSSTIKASPGTINNHDEPRTPHTPKKYYSSSTSSPISSTSTFCGMFPLMAGSEPELVQHENKEGEIDHEDDTMLLQDVSLSNFEGMEHWAY